MLPDLIATFPNPDNPQNLDRRIWFQQDGVLPYYAINVRVFWIISLMEGGLEGVDQ